MGKKKKVSQDDVRTEVVEAMKKQSPSERERRVLKLWTDWEGAKAFLAKVRSDTRTDVEMYRANLKERMELGLDGAGDDTAALRKLHSIEIAWQDLEEAKAKQKDATGGAKDGVKGAFERLSEAVSATRQIDLDFAADGSKVKAGSDDDADGESFEGDDATI